MTLRDLVGFRSRLEAGEAVDSLAAEAGLTSRWTLYSQWSRAGLACRAVAHGHRYLLNARMEAGLTQVMAARLIGISDRTYRRAEVGEVIIQPGRLQAWLNRMRPCC
jgi:hypothetical protein